MATQTELDNWYTYHSPTPEQAAAYAAIRAKAKELAELFNDSVPGCADATAAHRLLREAVMAMNLAIACNAQPGNAPSVKIENYNVYRSGPQGAAVRTDD